MAKRSASGPDALLARLQALRQAPSSPEFTAEMRKAIGHASPVVVARAAELAASYNRSDLVPDLVAAFMGFCDRGPDADKQFAARAGVARSLVDLYATNRDADDVYRRGVKLHGAGPIGYASDAAPVVRSACAFGLVNGNSPDAQATCVDLLVDPFPSVRSAAARALAASGRESAALVLRMKVREGDPEPDVLAECVTGMMAIAPAQSLDVAGEMLRHADPTPRAAAAVAIGASRLPEAVELLRGVLRREVEPDVRRAILLAAATTRSAEAVDWLVEVVSAADTPTAGDAVEALSPYRLDEGVVRRLREAVNRRSEPRLTERLERFASERSGLA